MTEGQGPRRVSRSQVHDEHLPSLPRVPTVQVPLLHRYYEDVRLPASLSPRFVVLRLAIPGAAPVVRSLRSRTHNRGPGVHNPVPVPERCTWRRPGSPKFLGSLGVLTPCSSTPAGPDTPGPYSVPTRSPGCPRRGLAAGSTLE